MASKLKEYRKKNRYSLRQIGEILGKNLQTVMRYETGKAHISAEDCKKLADLYGCKIEDLI